MNFKKAVCQIWGHDFVLSSKSFYRLDEDNKAVCTRCGKPKYMSFSRVETNSESESAVIYQNFNFMNNRQEFKPTSRTLN